MLQCAKPSLNRHLGHFFRQLAVQFRRKSGRPSFKNRHQDEDEDNVDGYIRKRKENQEDRLQLFKTRGQHLLTNPRILDSIVKNSGVGPEDTVLEIGPGTGNLTMKLLEAAKKVVAVEVDKRMVEVLHTRVSEHGLREKLTVCALKMLLSNCSMKCLIEIYYIKIKIL